MPKVYTIAELKALYEQYKGSYVPEDRNVLGFLAWVELVSAISQS